MKKFIYFVFFFLIVFFVEWFGHLLTMSSVNDWYKTLIKPSWTPPPWVFGPVWTILYIMIAISGWLIFIKVKSSRIKSFSLIVYAMQLLLNVAWSYFFFYLKTPLTALLDLALLIVLALINIILFTRLYRLAGFLLIPYLIWLIFAGTLNFSIAWMN